MLLLCAEAAFKPGGPLDVYKRQVYHIRNVYFMTDYNPMNIEQDLRFNVKDTVDYQGFRIFYGLSLIHI